MTMNSPENGCCRDGGAYALMCPSISSVDMPSVDITCSRQPKACGKGLMVHAHVGHGAKCIGRGRTSA